MIESIISAAKALEFVREEPPNTNGGTAVEAIQRSTGNKKGDPWCASFVSHCGLAALGKSWPLKLTGSVQQMYEDAVKKRLVFNDPEPGDIFVMWYPKLNRYAHTGIVISISRGKCTTIEGNTSGAGSREGWGVFTKERIFGPLDRFIRWSGAK